MRTQGTQVEAPISGLVQSQQRLWRGLANRGQPTVTCLQGVKCLHVKFEEQSTGSLAIGQIDVAIRDTSTQHKRDKAHNKSRLLIQKTNMITTV